MDHVQETLLLGALVCFIHLPNATVFIFLVAAALPALA